MLQKKKQGAVELIHHLRSKTSKVNSEPLECWLGFFVCFKNELKAKLCF